MRILTTDAWRRMGSTLLFDAEEIQHLLNEEAMVSLRTFLSWDKNIPENPPVQGQTLLICGLETVMDTLPANEAQEFLSRKIRPLVKKLQSDWTNTGLVFGFSQGMQVFQESNGIVEEVLFRRNDGTNVRISTGLWNGTAEQNMHRIEKRIEGQKVAAGYYVAHIS
jgi:hypothetical protein